MRSRKVVQFPDGSNYCQLSGCWLVFQLQYHILSCLNVNFVWYPISDPEPPMRLIFFVFLRAQYVAVILLICVPSTAPYQRFHLGRIEQLKWRQTDCKELHWTKEKWAQNVHPLCFKIETQQKGDYKYTHPMGKQGKSKLLCDINVYMRCVRVATFTIRSLAINITHLLHLMWTHIGFAMNIHGGLGNEWEDWIEQVHQFGM